MPMVIITYLHHRVALVLDPIGAPSPIKTPTLLSFSRFSLSLSLSELPTLCSGVLQTGMGLSSHLSDVSNDSIPILLVATAAGWVSYLRSVLFCLLHSFGLHHHHRGAQDGGDGSSSAGAVGSGLAGLILLAEQLMSAQRAFSYGHEGAVVDGGDCVVCLGGLREGDRVRRLSCCRRVFHCECLDGWFDQSKLSCPLCRAPLVPEEHRAEAARRVGAELADWLAPY